MMYEGNAQGQIPIPAVNAPNPVVWDGGRDLRQVAMRMAIEHCRDLGLTAEQLVAEAATIAKYLRGES